MVEVARHLLVAGHSIAYGGDLRVGGFTETLRDVARAYGISSARPRIFNYLAWPLHLHAADSDLAALAGVAVLRKLEAPSPSIDNGAETPFARVRAVSEMRKQMTARIDARVLLGGKLAGFKGSLPGLAEEGLLALQKSRPLFLLGAFGGCTGAFVEGIRNRRLPACFLEERFEEGLEPEALLARRALMAELKARVPRAPSLVSMGRAFEAHGVDTVAQVNRLSPDENEILFQSPNVPELVALILRGLSRLQRSVKARKDSKT
jgi:hypothetical protein